MATSAEAIVDLGAIAHNTRVLKRAMGDAALMAVVKADGFGHGAVAAARAAVEAGAGWVGVTSAFEALEQRAAGLDVPILAWMCGPQDDLAALAEARITLSVATLSHLDAIAAEAERRGVALDVHIKADTGLSRGGAVRSTWPELFGWARKYESAGQVRITGLWSHLANAEETDHPSLAAQQAAFADAIDLARAAGLAPATLHLANSAGILQVPTARFDLGRAGIALYGVPPVPGVDFDLRPAMTVRAGVVQAGDGRAVLPLGFGYGVPRRLGGVAEVLIHGVRRPIMGPVAMDHLVVDVGELPVTEGDEAVFLGPGDRGEPTAVEQAELAGTNPHELLTGIGVRLPRRHLLHTEA
ncbi:alanine racemase [Catenuloplanes japonicus]|uniref:alanine racemase n=1 Tax=Catenuloplanes japonicus TaxID=33876 RepID=UPI00052772E7|nr:alanine racemase [Catenuloplanes japonicus]